MSKDKNSAATTPVLSDDQLATLKQKHGDVLQITVTDDTDKTWMAYFRQRADRNTVGKALTHVNTDVIKFAETLVGGCYLAGDNFNEAPIGVLLKASEQLKTGLEATLVEVKNC